MYWLAIPAAAIFGAWVYGVYKATTQPRAAPIDPAFSPPPAQPQGQPTLPTQFKPGPGGGILELPTQFKPGLGGGILQLPTVPAGPEAPKSASGPSSTIQVGDTIIVDIAKNAGNLPEFIQGQIPMFVMALDVPGDFVKEFFLASFVRPEMMVLGNQPVRRSASRKAV
jgi:hypothetical protein